ncbi:MAG: SIMPL domain-containing protein [Candidatus Kaiserbacteria bacterium]|nr:SIMPL domain-containing protein [Candidatus Kaiserbacteria bacterium]
MEEQSVQQIIKATHWPRTMAATALGVLALFLLVSTISELKGLRFIGSGVAATNTISVNGEGEVFAVPDTATFSVTVREKAKEVKDAQDAATKKGNNIIAYLKEGGVEEKDIKTVDYSVNPDYEWSQGVCPQAGYCPPGKQVLVGYQVSQTLSVKVRDTKKAGDLLSGVGSRGATEVSGLSFTIDDEDALKAEARDKAIAQAKEKAEVLAESLGVSLVRVVGFYENEGGRPIFYEKAALGMGMGGDSAVSPAPEIPVGENKIVSNVSVTYEIR